MAVKNTTRIHNLILMQSIEETNPDIVEKLIKEEFKKMNQEEISFLLQDGLMGTFKDKDGNPLKLSNKTLQQLMLYKIDQFVDKKES